eukprot:4043186-Prymnesium_polylepis.1
MERGSVGVHLSLPSPMYAKPKGYVRQRSSAAARLAPEPFVSQKCVLREEFVSDGTIGRPGDTIASCSAAPSNLGARGIPP